MKQILLIEDDLSLINGVSFAIQKQGYETTVARTKAEADAVWEEGTYDLLILDVSLPDGSGFDICRKIRQTSKVPILFLSAADEETDMIMGLDIGGDDYITKPFKLAVLMSRINALLRRSSNFNETGTALSSGGITVQRLKGKVYKNDKELDLTASEYKLLCFFMENPTLYALSYFHRKNKSSMLYYEITAIKQNGQHRSTEVQNVIHRTIQKIPPRYLRRC